MEEEGEVSFKVYLKTAKGELEERRLLTERSHSLLLLRLHRLFPNLPHSEFSLTYTDCEGHNISVDTDELTIGLMKMPGEPFELNLKTRRFLTERNYSLLALSFQGKTCKVIELSHILF